MSTNRDRSVEEVTAAALELAKSQFKGNTAFSAAIGRIIERPPTPQAISQWKYVPVERVLAVEEVSGVSRHLLRPDIYGWPSTDAVEALFASAEAVTEE